MARRERLGIWTLSAAIAISETGNSMTSLAIPWFVLITTGSASRTGLAGAATALSPIVAGPLSGLIADRLGFKRTSIISDLMSGVTILLIPTLYLLDLLAFWHLLVLIFLGAFFDVPGRTARTALIPALARQSGMALERANSIRQLDLSLRGDIMAPLLAGVLISALGAANLLFIDAGTFAVSILIVWLGIQLPRRRNGNGEDGSSGAGDEPGGLLQEMLAGFRFFLADPALRMVLPVAILMSFLGSAYLVVLLPVYIERTFGEPAYLGLLITALGIGSIASTILYGAVGSRFSRYRTFVASFAMIAAAMWLFTLTTSLPVNLLAFLMYGIALGPLNPLFGVIVQTRTPEHMLGRVGGAIYTLFGIAAPLGGLAAGVSVDWLGLRPVLFVAAGLMSLSPLWLAFSPSARAAAPAFDA
jgi:MFS family permease